MAKPLEFNKDVVRKYCVELYGKINISLYHYAEDIKNSMGTSDLLKDKKHIYNKHLEMYDMLDQVIDILDKKVDSNGSSGSSGDSDDSGNDNDSNKLELIKDSKIFEDNSSNFNDFFEKYLRDVIMKCFKHIITINEGLFNNAFKDYKNYLNLSTHEQFTDFTTKVDTLIQNIKDDYKSSILTIIIIKILEIIKVLCCYNLYKKFLDIYTLINDKTDITTDNEKIRKYIDISIFVEINTIFHDFILQLFTNWLYNINVDEQTLINKINEMHDKVVIKNTIQEEINKTVS